MVYQDVTRNKNITAAAKGLYAYLSSFCGMDDECYPSIETITKEMGMGKDTFYRHINALVAAGVVVKYQTNGEGGKFGRTVYRLTHEVEINDFPNTVKSNYPFTQNEDTDIPITEHRETNINNTNINNINNNKKTICPEPEKLPPDPSDILLPLVDKSTYNVPLSKIDMWVKAYPAVDIRQELSKMIAWLESNPGRKKTRRGITRFIDSWLSREQDKGGRYRQQPAQPQTSINRQQYKEPEIDLSWYVEGGDDIWK